LLTFWVAFTILPLIRRFSVTIQETPITTRLRHGALAPLFFGNQVTNQD